MALALGLGLVSAPPALAEEDRGHGPADTNWPAIPPNPSPSAEEKALLAAQEQARSTGKPVLVGHLTTESSQTFANPGGSFTTDSTATVQRVKSADGGWKEVDATLHTNTDGMLAPAVVPSQLTLSGGGTGPMATMTTADGKKLAVTAPFTLPRPVLEDNSALYKSVLPDVDLRLTANTLGGWRQVLIVHTPEAAANPTVKKLRLAVEADGLNVKADAAGNISVTDTDGGIRFSSPSSLMWDSGTPSADGGDTGGGMRTMLSAPATAAEDEPVPSSPDGPGEGATVAPIAVTANNNAIDLVPDPALLSQGTGPWFIDPGFNPSASNTRQAYSQAQEAYPDTNGFNGTEYGQDKPATGFCGYNIGDPPCQKEGRTRAYFKIGINSAIHTKTNYDVSVINARFYTTIISSSSPSTSTPLGLYATPVISNPTSWQDQPCGTGSRMGGCTKLGASVPVSGTGQISFDVTNTMRAASQGGWTYQTFGLAPDDEYNKYYRQRFANDPHITVEYDVKPTIWWPRTRPTPGFASNGTFNDCKTPGTANPWDNPGWVGANNNITLTASTWSPVGRQLNTTFQLWDDDNNGHTTYPTTGWISDGEGTVDVGPLTDGHQYGWTARTTDSTLTSTDTDWCFFRIDRTPPTADVTSTDFPESGTIGARPKYAGQEGTFTLTGSDPAPAGGGRSSGLACARWTTDPVKAAATNWNCTDASAESGIVVLTGGKATVKITPPRWGTNFVYLQTQDNAGNMSQPAVYSYYAPSNLNGAAPVFGDITGDSKPDIVLPDGSGTLRTIEGRTGDRDPSTALASKISAAPTGNSWSNVRIAHRGNLAYKNVDDLFAHDPSSPENLYLYSNANIDGVFNLRDRMTVTKPANCVNTSFAAINCSAYYGIDWRNVTQIAAFGAPSGDAPVNGALPKSSLLFVENGRLWLSSAAPTDINQLENRAIQLSANDDRWKDYTLIAPGRAKGTNFPTLWARSKSGSIHSFAITGTPEAPVLTGFTDPTKGAIPGIDLDPAAYPRVGSDGDITGDGIPDLWAVDTQQQLVAFRGTGTAPNGTTVLHPTVTGFDPAPVSLGNLNKPAGQWKLTTDDTSVDPTPEVTWPTATIGGTSTPYAAFSGPSSRATLAGPTVDTRKSFTVSVWTKSSGSSGVVVSQDGNRSSTFTLYPDGGAKVWRFALSKGDADGWNYDWTGFSNDAARVIPNAWTRLTAVYDAPTSQMRLYVNGTLASTGYHKATDSPAPTGVLALGRYKRDGAIDTAGGYTGGIGNLAHYSYAASPSAPGATGPITLASTATNCVDNDNGRATDGNAIQLWTCTGAPNNQQFQIHHDGTIRIQGKCLNAENAGTANGTLIQLWTCNGTPAQRFVPRADGSVHNPASIRCLDLPQGNKANGTRLQLWDCNTTEAQRWTIPTLNTAVLPIPTY
ncbi:ricin-type beta-trefoil lectin domain protein [Streptomyces sp. NPDC002054]|uniref:ricin-type beta-trefoil lectin domain protein n=1 Tax=Streptomyces sp. NPDC002054 TaxID=3154663 RepID=UPI00332BB792